MEEVVFQSLFFVVFVYCCQKGTKTVDTMLKDQPRMNCIEEIVGKFWIRRVVSETKNKFTCDNNQVDGNAQNQRHNWCIKQSWDTNHNYYNGSGFPVYAEKKTYKDKL